MPNRELMGPLRWSPDSRYILCEQNYYKPSLVTALVGGSASGATSRVVVYRVSDGAEYPVLDPWTAEGREFEWIKTPRKWACH
jgi:hypothetical protein